MKATLDGEPWYGRSMYSILNEIHPAVVFKRLNEEGHSMIDLLYHMITWTQFTLQRIRHEPKAPEGEDEETLDWRLIDPLEHTWVKGLEQLRDLHDQIIMELESRDDSFLNEMVEFRGYSFRFLLNGLIQHDIYHLGQIAMLKKSI